MRVGIYSDILNNKCTGVEYYTINLIKNLTEPPLLIYNYKIKNSLFKDSHKITFNRNPIPIINFIFSIFYRGPRNIHLLHSPTPKIPFFRSKIPLIVTVHDITPKLFPIYHPFMRKLYFKIFFKFVLNRSKRIIVDSHATKNDLIKYFNVKQKKIKVIYLGVSKIFRPTPTNNDFKRRYNLPKEYILFVGTKEPRKNLKRLIQAYNQLLKEEYKNIKLVIVGKMGWGGDKLPKNIINLRYVNEKDLPALYSNAEIFIYPSIYEGFGLPILEAMACGCPVITSNVSSLPEVAGSAAILINPYDINELTQAIKNVLTNKKLRKNLISKGFMQAKKFSWEKCARETEKVYEEVYYENRAYR